MEIGVLDCPVCDQVRLCRLRQRPEELKEIATTHLRTHVLTESKRGIYRIMMVEQIERIGEAESTTLPADTWTTVDEAEPS